MLLTRYSAVSHVDNLVHLLHVTSDSYARGVYNPEQLCIVFLQSLTFGHFYIKKSFPKWENLKISNNAINKKDRCY